MANGRFSPGGMQVIADAALVFVGNLKQPVETLAQNSAADLFRPMPVEIEQMVGVPEQGGTVL